jgi:molecular chaperone DnaJ
MDQNFDPYRSLGVEKNASDDDIKKAYRKMSKQYHPDLNKDNPKAEEKFKEVNAAYQILSDKQKRQQYDQFGSAAFGQGPQGGGAGFGGYDFGGGAGFADIFETFFGGSGGFSQSSQRRNRKGQDIEVQVTIQFEEAAFGTEKTINLNKFGACQTCKGKGAEPGSNLKTCDTCRGTGEVTSVKNTILGQMRAQSVCHNCTGIGNIPEKKCSQCHGQGRAKSNDEITVRVPAGVSNGTTLRLSGKGDAGLQGEQSGDLYVHIRVQPSLEFERQGEDIYSSHKIHVLQAILGDEVPVKTLHGEVTLKIPAGTTDGKVFKIKGYGVPRINSSAKGDHLVKIELEVPQKLMGKEREHYEELAKLAKLGTKSKQKGFFDKLFRE